MSGSSRVFASARLIALLTFASRLLGFLRDAVLTYFFGASELFSAFSIAFQAPNLARRLFGEGALSAAMVPVLTESLQTRGEEASRRLVGTILVVLTVVLGAGVVLVELIVYAWRMVHDDAALQLVAVMMPYMVLICLTAVIGGVLNVLKSFAIPAAAPVILNVVIIAATVIGALGMGLAEAPLMRLIAVSVLLGGVLQLAATTAGLRVVRFRPILGGDWRDEQVRKVCALLLPMTLGLSAMQLNTLADQLIAYWFIQVDGERVGPAVLRLAQLLYQLPLGVLGISLATAIFPALAERAAAGDHAGMSDILGRGVRLTLFTALPAAVGLIFVAKPLAAAAFCRGEFDAADAARVAATLSYYCIGLPAYFTQHLLIRAFYALHDSKTPARIAGWMVAADFTMNLALVFPLQERGLALSTSVCSLLQTAWLAVVLSRRVPVMSWRLVSGGVGRIVVATGVMTVALFLCGAGGPFGDWIGPRDGVRLLVLPIVGVAAYFTSAYVLRMKELTWMFERSGKPTPSSH